MIETPAHLGGHLGTTWIDVPVLEYLIDRYNVRRMIDVGCGPGGMIDIARMRGVQAWGIDGDPAIEHERVITHDYATGPLPMRIAPLAIDLIWCVEFVEHVETKYQPNYLATFDSGRVVFLTAAYPGQGGHHHVNEQPEGYWIDLLRLRGWQLDEEATRWVRAHGATPFARMTGMVFTKSAR